MQPDLEAFRTFVAVADAGGLTAASGRLSRTVPALSWRLTALERQLGVSLFDRTTKRFRLTRAGQALLECGRRVLGDVDAVVALIRQQKEATRREIVVAAFGAMSYGLLPRAIRVFEKRFPATRIYIRELASPGVIDAVARQAADIGIAVKGPIPPSLTFKPILNDPFVLACTNSSRFAERQRVTWEELGNEKLIGFVDGTVNRVLLDRALHAKNVRIAWRYEVQQHATALGLVEQGLGLSTIPLSAISSVKDSHVRAIRLVRPIVLRTVGLVQRRDDLPSEPITAFIECLVDIVRQDNAGGQAEQSTNKSRRRRNAPA